MNTLKDAELVAKTLNEDLDAFAVLINRYEEPLKNYILRISNVSLEEAEDILQESMIKAWKNLHSFNQDFKFSTWLYRIVHNEVISNFRKAKSRGEKGRVDYDEYAYLVPDQKLTANLVSQALAKLKPDYREVLVLKYFEDKSYEEISDILKKPAGTIATLLNRAKKDFKARLQKINLNS